MMKTIVIRGYFTIEGLSDRVAQHLTYCKIIARAVPEAVLELQAHSSEFKKIKEDLK